MLDLKSKWNQLAQEYSQDSSLIGSLWEEIELAYTHKKRHYHNLNHIAYMLNKAYEFHDEIEDMGIFSFSIFYHDIVYNTSKKDNEEKSAQLAKKRLEKLGLSDEQILKCEHQIIATKLHNEQSSSDTNYLVDIDLAILAEDWPIYLNYTLQIRKEYSIYPEFMYRKGRKKVLHHFLDMDRIFKTDTFFQAREQNARKNLEKELNSLL